MSEEKIKINKLDGSITFINNGISFSQFGIAKEILDLITNLQQKVEQLEKELQTTANNCKQLENIRKEIKEYIEKNVACFKNGDMLVELNVDDLLNILNKGDNK